MRAGMLIFCFMIWLVALLLTSSYEQYAPTSSDYVGQSLGGQNRLSYAMNMKNIVYRSNGLGNSTFVGFNTDYFDNLWQMITFSDVTFFGGWLELVRWFLLCVTAGIMFSIVIAMVSVITAIASFFKPI
jgi:hypothetical protein